MADTEVGDIIEGHDYDGIQELNNDLPRWWLHGFYYTIVFAVVYMVYYHFSGLGPSPELEFLTEMSAAGYRVPAEAVQGVRRQDLALGLMGVLFAVAALLFSDLMRFEKRNRQQH